MSGAHGVKCIARVSIFAFHGIPLAHDDGHALACLGNDASKPLVEGSVVFIHIHQKEADIGFLDGSQSAQDAKLLDAHLLLALAANASGVEQLDGLPLVAQADAIDIARGARHPSHNGLLLACQCVEEAGFAHIGPADQSNLEYIAWLGLAFLWDVLADLIQRITNTTVVLGTGADDALDAKAEEFTGGQAAPQVGFVCNENDRFATLEGGLGDAPIFITGVFGAVHHHEDNVGRIGCISDLLLNTCLKLVFGWLEAGGVDEPKLMPMVGCLAHHPIARCASLARHDGLL